MQSCKRTWMKLEYLKHSLEDS